MSSPTNSSPGDPGGALAEPAPHESEWCCLRGAWARRWLESGRVTLGWRGKERERRADGASAVPAKTVQGQGVGLGQASRLGDAGPTSAVQAPVSRGGATRRQRWCYSPTEVVLLADRGGATRRQRWCYSPTASYGCCR
eukprot:356353-Chlamydomonas_euryale.AAC.2